MTRSTANAFARRRHCYGTYGTNSSLSQIRSTCTLPHISLKTGMEAKERTMEWTDSIFFSPALPLSMDLRTPACRHRPQAIKMVLLESLPQPWKRQRLQFLHQLWPSRYNSTTACQISKEISVIRCHFLQFSTMENWLRQMLLMVSTHGI